MIGTRLNVNKLRLPMGEPDHIQFLTIRGTDAELEVAHVQLPVGQGFKDVEYGETYCYLLNGSVFTGKYKHVGSVGLWHATPAGVDFKGDGEGLLGGRGLSK